MLSASGRDGASAWGSGGFVAGALAGARSGTLDISGPALGSERNRFRVDWLFSYQPTPGTVVFAGYGSTLSEPDGLRFRALRRDTDGFFLKVSYLFRM